MWSENFVISLGCESRSGVGHFVRLGGLIGRTACFCVKVLVTSYLRGGTLHFLHIFLKIELRCSKKDKGVSTLPIAQTDNNSNKQRLQRPNYENSNSMTNNYLTKIFNNRVLSLVAALLLLGGYYNTLKAQTINVGDFRTAVATADFNTAAHWQKCTASNTWSTAGAGGTPTSTSAIWIQSGHALTCTKDATVAAIYLNTTSTAASITIANGVTLTNDNNGTTNYIALGAYTGATSVTTANHAVTAAAPTSASAITTTGTGLIKFTGSSRTITSSTWVGTPTGWNAEFALTSGQTGTFLGTSMKAGSYNFSSGTYNFSNKDIRADVGTTVGTGTVTIGDGVTVNNVLDICNSSTTSAKIASITLNGTATLNMNSGLGTGCLLSATNLTMNGTSQINNANTGTANALSFANIGTLTVNGTNNVIGNNGLTASTITLSPTTLAVAAGGSLNITNTGTTNAITASPTTLTVAATGTLTCTNNSSSTGIITLSPTTLTITAGGQLTTAGSSSAAGAVTINPVNSITYNATNDININVNTTWTGPAGTLVSPALVFSNTGGFNIASGKTLTFGTATSFTDMGTNAAFKGAGALTTTAGTTLIVKSSNGVSTTASTGNIQVTGTRTYGANTIFNYSGSGAQNTGNGPTAATSITINNTAGVTIADAGSSPATSLASLACSTATINASCALNFGIVAQTVTVNGLLSCAGTLNMTGAGLAHVLNIAGGANTMTGTFNTTASSGSTVSYTGIVAQNIFGSPNYQKLTVSVATNAIAKTMTGSVTTADVLAITGNGTTTASLVIGAGNTLTINGGFTNASTIGITGSATSNLAIGTSGTANTTAIGSTASPVSLGTAFTAINNFDYNNTASGSSLVLAANLAVSGNATIYSGRLNLSTFTFTGTASKAFTMSNTANAVLGQAGASNFPVSFGTYSLGANSVVDFNGAIAQNIMATPYSATTPSNYGSILISGATAKTLATTSSITFNGSLTVNTGCAFAFSASAQTLNVTGATTVSGTGTLTMAATVSQTLALNSTLDLTGGTINMSTSAATSTVTIAGAVNVTSGTGTINLGGTNAKTVTLNGGATGAGTLAFNYNTAALAHTVNFNGATSITAISFPTASTGGTFTYGGNAVTDIDQTIYGGITYPNLTLGNNSTAGITKTLKAGTTTTIGGTNGTAFLINSGVTLDFGTTSACTLTVTASATAASMNASAATIKMQGSGLAHVLNLGGTSNTCAVLQTSGSNSTVNYTSTGATVTPIFASANYQNLGLSSTASIKSLAGNVTVAGTLTIGANNTLALNGKTLTLNGGFLNSGTAGIGGDAAATLNIGTSGTANTTVITANLGTAFTSVLNYTLNNTGLNTTLTQTAALSIPTGGSFNVTAGRHNLAATTLTGAGTATFALGASGILGTTTAATTFPVTGFTSFDLPATSVVDFNLAGTQTISVPPANVSNGGVASYGALSISGSGTKTILASNSITTIGALSVNAGTLSFAASGSAQTLNVGGNLTVAGTLTTGSFAVAHTLNLAGTTNTNSGTFTVNGNANHVVNYNSTGTQNIIPATYQNLVLSNGTGGALKTLATGTTATVSNTLTVGAADNLQLLGTAGISLAANASGTGTISGAVSNTASITFSGSAQQTFPLSISAVDRIIMAKTGTFLANTVLMSQDASVNNLVFNSSTSGVLVTGSAKIILPSTAIFPPANVGTGAYVVGSINYTIPTSGSNYTFPLGFTPSTTAASNYYRPITLNGLTSYAGGNTGFTVSLVTTPGSNISSNYASPPVAVSSDDYYSVATTTPSNLFTSLSSVALAYSADANIGTQANTTVSQLVSNVWVDKGASYSGTSPIYATTTGAINGTGSASDVLYFALGSKAFSTIYVRTDGDDNNSGTANSAAGAKRTITAGIAAVTSGGTVNVAADGASANYSSETPVLSKDFNLVGPTTGTATVGGFILGNAAQVVVKNFTSATGVNTATDVITATAHGLATGERVVYEAMAGSITGLTSLTGYYVIVVDADNFKLATTFNNALTGTSIDITAVAAVSPGVVLNGPAALTGVNRQGPTSGEGYAFFHVFTRAQAISGNFSAPTVSAPANTYINNAITLSATSGTVSLAAGHYYQSVSLSKSITLDGVGKYQTVINGGYQANSSSTTNKAGITLGANSITVSDLSVRAFTFGIISSSSSTAGSSFNTISLSNLAITNNGAHGIQASGLSGGNVTLSDYTIDGCNLDSNGVVNSYGSGFYYRGFAASPAASISNLTIKNSTLTQNNNAGISITNATAASNILISSNTINNNGDLGISFGDSVISGYATSSNIIISDNSINLGLASYTWGSNNAQRFGIELRNVTGDGNSSGSNCFAVLRNAITQSTRSVTNSADYAGIAIVNRGSSSPSGFPSSLAGNSDPSKIYIAYNLISGIKGATGECSGFNIGDGFGIVVSGTGIKVRYNVVTSCDVGIQAQSSNTAANLKVYNGCGTLPTANTGYETYFDRDYSTVFSPTTNPCYINYNSFQSNTIALRNVVKSGSGNGTVDATGNWWNNASGPANASYNSTGTGQALAITSNPGAGTPVPVAFSPWLKSDPDYDNTAIGVQVQSALTYQVGGTQTSQSGLSTNLSLVSNLVSSTYTDNVEVDGSTYPNTVGESISSPVIFNLKGYNNATINQFTLNNASAVITLTGPIRIKSRITLTNGVIKGNGNVVSLSDALNFLGVSNGAGYIDGTVSFDNTGTFANQSLLFPLGVSGVGARYVTLQLTQASSALATYSASITSASATALNYALPGTLDRVSSTRYYNLAVTGNTFSAGTLTLTYDNDDQITDAPNLRIAGDNGTASAWTDFGGTGASGTAGTVSTTTAAVSTLGTFTLANATGGSNMPSPVYVAPVAAGLANGSSAANPTTLAAGLALIPATGGTLYMAGGDYAGVSVVAPTLAASVPFVLNRTAGSVLAASNFNITFSTNFKLSAPLPASGDIEATSVTLADNTNNISDAILIAKTGTLAASYTDAGIITVPGGNYQENLTISKSVKLKGANFGKTGTSVRTQPETNIQRSSIVTSGDDNVITVTASGVTIDGFLIDGTNAGAVRGIATGTGTFGASTWASTNSYFTIQNNIIQNIANNSSNPVSGIGIFLNGPGTTATTNNTIANNQVRLVAGNFGTNILNTTPAFNGSGIVLFNNNYADVTGNTIKTTNLGLYHRYFSLTGSGTISANIFNIPGSSTVPNYSVGIMSADLSGTSSFTISGNTLSDTTGVTTVFFAAMEALNVTGTASLTYSTNNVSGAWGTQYLGLATVPSYGYNFYNCSTSNPVSITGGTITNIGNAVNLFNRFGTGGSGTAPYVYASSSTYNINNLTTNGCWGGIYSDDQGPGNMVINASGCSFLNCIRDPLNSSDNAAIRLSNFDNTRNFYLSVDQCYITGSANRAMSLKEPVSTSITNSTITGNGTVSTDGSITLRCATAGVTMNNITITNNIISSPAASNVGELFFQITAGTLASPVTIYNNNFSPSNATNKGIVWQTGGTIANNTIDASGNYWGYTDAASVKTMATQGLLAASTQVDYSGWLNSNTNSVTSGPGFSGDFKYLNITNDASTGGQLPAGSTRFSDALNLLTESTSLVPCTLNIQGTTATTATVTKNVTIENNPVTTMSTGTAGTGLLTLVMNGSGKTATLARDFTLAGLTLTNGYVDPNSKILNVPSTGVSGGSTSSYVKGPLSLNFTGTSSTLTFPIGTNNATSSYRPLTFITGNSVSGTNTYTAALVDKLVPSTAPAIGTIGTRPPTVKGTDPSFSPFRYFTLTRNAASTGTFQSGTVILNYSTSGLSDDQVTDPTNLKVVTDNGTFSGTNTWTDLGGSASVSGNGSITSTTPFTAFALGATFNLMTANGLLGTNYGATNNNVYVNWLTGNDLNDGSVGSPFKTVDKAIKSLSTVSGSYGTVNIVPTVSGSPDPGFTIDRPVKFVCSGTQSYNNVTIVAPGAIDPTSSVGVSFNNVNINAGTTITSALTLAADGATINIGSGTYSETVTVTKNYTFASTGTPSIGSLVMNGSGKTLTLSSGFNINSTLTLTAGNVAINNSTLTLNGSLSTATGQFQATGAAPSLVINGTGNLGSTLSFDPLNNTLANLTVNRTSGGVQLGADLNVTGVLSLQNGRLDLNDKAFGLTGTANVTFGNLRVSQNANLTIGNGSGGPFGALAFDLTTPGTTNILNNFTLNRGPLGALNLSSDLIVNGALNVTGSLSIGSNKLTINGTYNNNGGAGKLIGSSTSDLSVAGSAPFTLSLDNSNPGVSNQIRTLTFANGIGTVTLGSDIVVGSSLSLAANNLNIGSNTLTINGTASGTGKIQGSTSSSLNIGGSGSFGTLSFDQTGTNGKLANLTINRGTNGIVTLGSALEVTNSLNMSSGIFALGSNTLTVSGSFNNLGAFIRGSSTGNLSITGTSGSSDAGAIVMDQTIPTFTAALASLSLNRNVGGIGSASLGSDLVTSSLNIGANNNLDLSAFNLTINGTSSGAGSGSISGAFATFNLNGSGSYSLPSGSVNTFNNNRNATVALGGDLAITNTVLNAGTLDLNGNMLTLASGGTITYGTGTTLKGSATSKLTSNTAATLNFTSGSRVLSNLTLGAGAGTTTLGNDLTVNDVFSLGSASALAIGSNTLTLGTTQTGTGTISGTTSSNLVYSSGVTAPALSMSSGAQNLNNLTLTDANSTLTLGSGLTLNGNLISSATPTLNLNDKTLVLKGSINSDVTIKGSALSGLTLGGGTTTAYTLKLSTATPGTSNQLATLGIASGTTVTATDATNPVIASLAFSSASSALVIGTNTLTLSGDLSGSGLLAGSTTSALSVTGTGPLGTLNFDQSANTLSSLNFNRTVLGSATLGNKLNVTNNVTTTNGVLTVSDVLVLADAATLTESNANSSRVVGVVQKTVVSGLATTGSFYNTGIGLEIKATTTALGANTVINRVTLPAGTYLNGVPNTAFASNKSIGRYYDIIPSNTGDKNAYVKMTFMDVELVTAGKTPVNLYRAPLSDPTSWTRYAGILSGNDFYNTTPIVDFSRITLSDVDNPLPVTYLSFTATRQRSEVSLAWATAQEESASYFDIERSTDGFKFTKIGRVSASGNSSTRKDYRFEDKMTNVIQGTVYYYRLRQVDVNGAFDYSKVVVVNFDKPQVELLQAFYPNPARDVLNVTVDVSTPVDVAVYDVLGKLVREYKLDASNSNLPIDVSMLKPGMYNISFSNGIDRVNRKLTIE